MDMSSSSTTSDMEGWKSYLHTSLFSPFSNVPDSGEAFLFPTFRIYSRTTFLAACAFTFCIALVERFLTHVLASLPLNHSSQPSERTPGRRNGSTSRSVYVHIPTTEDTSSRAATRGRKAKVALRGAVYFAATLLRYLLMIIGMGMDWVLLGSVVSGLTVGQVLADCRAVAKQRKADGRAREVREAEERVLLEENAFDDDEVAGEEREDEEKVRDRGDGMAHRRSGSRMSQTVLTP